MESPWTLEARELWANVEAAKKRYEAATNPIEKEIARAAWNDAYHRHYNFLREAVNKIKEEDA